MELCKFINYLFIVLLSQVVNCFEFDLERRSSRRLPLNSQFRQILNANVNNKPNAHNQAQSIINTSRGPYYWKHNRNGSNQSNYREKMFLFSSISRHRSTTPTYIEFDYLYVGHNGHNEAKSTSMTKLHRIEPKVRRTELDKTRLPFIWRSSSVSYRFKNPYNDQELRIKPLSNPLKNFQDHSLHSQSQTINPLIMQTKKKINNNIRTSDLISNQALLGQNMFPVKLKNELTTKTKTTIKLPKQSTTDLKTRNVTTDDRVKFFEMYDINTPPNRRIKLNISTECQSSKLSNITNNTTNQETQNFKNLWHVGSPNKTRVERQYTNLEKPSFQGYRNLTKVYKSQKSIFLESLSTSAENSTIGFSKSNPVTHATIAHWYSFPFASVYVYKPTETHCDAAGISPHWLLAAGSCLSRHSLAYSVDLRSAYVTYCGEHWRWPERIAYVKRSVLHPKFNPRDKARRLLYNIGLIQVSSSMAAACPGWKPISLMSHQFTAGPAGVVASAVGWGLDRYGSQYTTEKLWPLSIYNAVVYHNICPGSPSYTIAKRQGDISAGNVYCLLLPPYTGEENDPVHGGLLMVGEQLVALYLQEERRGWGSQSAQYTGVWRLLPWITDVAYEPEDADLTFDV